MLVTAKLYMKKKPIVIIQWQMLRILVNELKFSIEDHIFQNSNVLNILFCNKKFMFLIFYSCGNYQHDSKVVFGWRGEGRDVFKTFMFGGERSKISP